MVADMTAPTFTLAQAAIACNASQSILRRRRSELLRRAGAIQTAKGAWQIPITALFSVGLMENTTPPFAVLVHTGWSCVPIRPGDNFVSDTLPLKSPLPKETVRLAGPEYRNVNSSF